MFLTHFPSLITIVLVLDGYTHNSPIFIIVVGIAQNYDILLKLFST